MSFLLGLYGITLQAFAQAEPSGVLNIGTANATNEAVRRALRAGDYPWYDRFDDRYRRVRILPEPDIDLGAVPSTSGLSPLAEFFGTIGQAIVVLIFVAALIGMIILLLRFTGPAGDLFGTTMSKKGPSRVIERAGSLPAGLDIDTNDPLAAATEARKRGDLTRAIVFLFAYQLISLDRLGLLRLSPGRTGRQLVRSITDSEVRSRVDPTLRLFEAVYYGHRVPDSIRFEFAWRESEALDRLLMARASS